MGNRRQTSSRRSRLPTPLHSCALPPQQPLGCGPLLCEEPCCCASSAADHAPVGPCGCGCNSRQLLSARGSWRFEVPSALARRTAIGSNSGVPFMLQRVLHFSEVWFEPIPEPRPRDWLSLHPELMQTFDAFRTAFSGNKASMGPSPERQCLHLLPLGPGAPEPGHFSHLRSICEAFFWPLRVAVLRKPSDAPVPGPCGEINGDEVLAWMTPGLRANSALTVAITEAPLRSGGHSTIGASDWGARVCVLSVAQYIPAHPSVTGTPLPRQGTETPLPRLLPEIDAAMEQEDDALGDSASYRDCSHGATSSRSSPSPPPHQLEEKELLRVVFERIAKLILHEAVHMFGILHCCYYRCLMNGSSTLDEVDSKPPYLCGMCLKKLHLVLGFDPVQRYVKLAHAWAVAEREDISRWYSTRVALVQTTLASCRGQPPGALASQRSGPAASLSLVPKSGPSRPASSMSKRVHTVEKLPSARRAASSQGFRSRARSPSSGETSPEPDVVPATFLRARNTAETKMRPAIPLPPSMQKVRTARQKAPLNYLQSEAA